MAKKQNAHLRAIEILEPKVRGENFRGASAKRGAQDSPRTLSSLRPKNERSKLPRYLDMDSYGEDA